MRYVYDINDFGFSGAHFPIHRFDIEQYFALTVNPTNAERCFACIAMKEDDEIHFKTWDTVREIILNFSAIYSMFSPLCLSFKGGGAQRIQSLDQLCENPRYTRIKIGPTIMTPEQQKEEKDRITQWLNQSKNAWETYKKIPNIKLKKNITNALHYLWYGKSSDRIEDGLVNTITGLECLLLEDNDELAYKISHRGAFIIHHFTKEGKKELFQFIKSMYNERSNLVHDGELKKLKDTAEVRRLQHYLSLIIRTYMVLSESYNTKKEIINLIEEGILGRTVKLPNVQKIDF